MANKEIGFCINDKNGTFRVFDEDGKFMACQLGQCLGWSDDYAVRTDDSGRTKALGFNGKTSFNF